MKRVDTGIPLLWPSLQDVVNVASVPQRSPFRYPGGKTWLVPHLRRWLLGKPARPGLFVEPFAGGAIAGLTVAFEHLAERVLLVEIDPDVASVWKAVLNGKAEELAERIGSFRLTLDNVRKALRWRPRTMVDRAFVTVLRNRVQHGGILAPGASLMRDGENGKGIGSRWYPDTLARRIRSIAEMKQRLAFLKADAFAVLELYKEAADAVHFVDPPYTVAGRRLYRYSQVDHRKLFVLMSRVAGDFLMTYDDTPEVRQWADSAGFQFERVVMQGRQNARKSELLIARDLSWARP